MKALTWHGSGDIRCEEVDDAIIKVTSCAIWVIASVRSLKAAWGSEAFENPTRSAALRFVYSDT